MKTYKYEVDYTRETFDIGKRLWIGDEQVVVVTILRVDFDNKIIWFSGVEFEDLH